MLNEEMSAVQYDIKQKQSQVCLPRSREAVSVFKMPDMQTSQRCKHREKTRPGHGDAKTTKEMEGNRRSLKKHRTRLNGYPRKFVRVKKVAKSMKLHPMLRYDVGVYITHAHRIASRIVSGVARLCASTLVLGRTRGLARSALPRLRRGTGYYSRARPLR